MKLALRTFITLPLAGKLSSPQRCLSSAATAASGSPESDETSSLSSSFTFSDGGGVQSDQKNSGDGRGGDDRIHLKPPNKSAITPPSSSVSMPMSFMTGSIVGKRFYKRVTTREAEDCNGWTVMLDYRTLKSPYKRVLKLPNLALATAIAAEWDYQETDGIRPFTMPLMKLACTALERVPLTRTKIIEELLKKFHQDLVFCRAPADDDLTRGVLERQMEKLDPLLDWVESEFGVKPIVYSSIFGGKQEDALVKAIESVLKKTNNCELAAVDAIAAAGHSLIIGIGILRGKLLIEEAIKLIRLEEDLQVDKWGLVEGGHDVDVADLTVQVSSAAVFLGLSRRI